MDFNKFDSRTASATGREMHIKHPATGEPLYSDDKKKNPCIVVVLGTESDAVQARIREVLRERAKAKKGENADSERALADVQKNLVEQALPLVAGFKNVMCGDRPATVDDAAWFLGLQTINGSDTEQAFVQQVLSFATTRANYLGNA